jgi:hypothetical protein
VRRDLSVQANLGYQAIVGVPNVPILDDAIDFLDEPTTTSVIHVLDCFGVCDTKGVPRTEANVLQST